jgi:hypothetical protein
MIAWLFEIDEPREGLTLDRLQIAEQLQRNVSTWFVNWPKGPEPIADPFPVYDRVSR